MKLLRRRRMTFGKWFSFFSLSILFKVLLVISFLSRFFWKMGRIMDKWERTIITCRSRIMKSDAFNRRN